MKNKILIVDDAEINRSLLADILSVEYDITEASNGVEAVSLLNQYHADLSLILLDIVMPEMDGFEVLAIMNRNGWIQSIPVITIRRRRPPAILNTLMTWERPIISAAHLMRRRCCAV